MEAEKTYWNENGKYQAFVEQLDDKAPSSGYTNNIYMNLYLTMAHLYYDAYNNGGGNIEECYLGDFNRNVAPYLPNIKVEPFIDCSFEEMEGMMNQALEYLYGKGLDFPIFTVWLNTKDYSFSRIEPPSDLPNRIDWHPITFGLEENLQEWCRFRSTIDHDATNEILQKVQGKTLGLDQQIAHAEARKLESNLNDSRPKPPLSEEKSI